MAGEAAHGEVVPQAAEVVLARDAADIVEGLVETVAAMSSSMARGTTRTDCEISRRGVSARVAPEASGGLYDAEAVPTTDTAGSVISEASAVSATSARPDIASIRAATGRNERAWTGRKSGTAGRNENGMRCRARLGCASSIRNTPIKTSRGGGHPTGKPQRLINDNNFSLRF